MDKTPTQWMVTPLRKYATFEGRARRKEYWWFALFVILVITGLAIFDIMLVGLEEFAVYGGGPLVGLGSLALVLPNLGVAVRRLHDHDRSGWYVLLGLLPFIGAIILLYWYVTRGTVGDNRFGSDPLAEVL